MMHRSTPHSATGVSPAELLYGRKLRTTDPVLSSSLKPSWPDAFLIREKDQHYKHTYTKNYNKHHGVRDYDKFNQNQDVCIKIDSHNSGNLQQSKKLTTSRAAMLSPRRMEINIAEMPSTS